MGEKDLCVTCPEDPEGKGICPEQFEPAKTCVCDDKKDQKKKQKKDKKEKKEQRKEQKEEEGPKEQTPDGDDSPAEDSERPRRHHRHHHDHHRSRSGERVPSAKETTAPAQQRPRSAPGSSWNPAPGTGMVGIPPSNRGKGPSRDETPTTPNATDTASKDFFKNLLM